MTENNPYLSLVGALLPDPPKTIEAASRQLGIAFKTLKDGNIERGQASGESATGLIFDDISLRFLPDGKASLFSLTLPADHAPLRQDVAQQVDGLAITAMPRGRSESELIELSRSEYWGTLVFGFEARDPDRLRLIVFRYGVSDEPR